MMGDYKDVNRNIELDFSKIDINRQNLRNVGENRSNRFGYGDSNHSRGRGNGIGRQTYHRNQPYEGDRMVARKGRGSDGTQRAEQGYCTPVRGGSGLNRPSSSAVKKTPDERVPARPATERSMRKESSSSEFSFMKETASSLQRKVHNSPSLNSISSDAKRNRTVSATKRRQEYMKSLPKSLSRQNLSSALNVNTHPFDITNLQYDHTEKYTNNKPKSMNISHTKNMDITPSRIQKDPTHTANDEVKAYDRLYNFSKTKVKDSRQLQVDDTKKNYDTLRPTPLSKKPRPSTDVRNLKVGTFHGLYSYIYNKDSTLFKRKTDSLYQSRKPYSMADLEEEKSFNVFERGEILHNQDIYYISRQPNSSLNIRDFKRNFGFDDKDNNYIATEHDHINYRYEIDHVLGNGSFGNVMKCDDHKFIDQNNTPKPVAVKIIKNDINWSCQAVYEIKMLRHLNDNDPHHPSVLKYLDHFHFRGHMCIVTELLSLNLYSMLELLDFKGVSLQLTKYFSTKILHGLQFIHKLNIIHCDIKPENIMIKLPPDFDPKSNFPCSDLIIKIIDFGSSCFDSEKSYTYIQSRFYRAPEVILGASYDYKIDIWSFGCVIAELFSGLPLLPGKSELEQIGLILELFGAPKSSMITGMRRKLQISLKSSPSKITSKSTLDDLDLTKANDKNIRKTLLYNLFDAKGKINLNFLNQRAINMPNGVKKHFKLNSKNIGVLLKLQQSAENQAMTKAFYNFLMKIFNWDPQDRSSVDDLLEDEFML